MSGGARALLSLREHWMSKQQPQWAADRQSIQIGSESFPAKTLTPYKIRGKNDFYPLDAIVFALEREKDAPASYIAAAVKQGLSHVSFMQRKELLQYLKGEISSTPDIDVSGLQRYAAGGELKGEERKEGEEGPPSKRARLDVLPVKPVSEWSGEDIMREEVPLASHLSILKGGKKNLSSFIDIYQKAMRESSSSSSHHHAPSSHRSQTNVKLEKSRPGAPILAHRDPKHAIPIIVVPAAVSAVINMYNAKQFFDNGTFVSGELCRSQSAAAGQSKPSSLTFTRASYYDPSKSVTYEVIDDVRGLKCLEDWNRVVGICVSGQSWQFSDWPKKQWPNPAAIFEKVAAFHIYFEDEALHPNILQWRTHRLPISKTKRHGDRSVVLDFWHILLEFIAARNATKRLNI